MYGLKKRSKQDESGLIQGAGTGTSDSIKKNVPAGSYIMPADSTKQIGANNLKNMGSPTPVNLSNGEFQLSPDQVHSVGVQTLENMKAQTHTPVDQPQLGFKPGKNKPELFFANGGEVEYRKERKLVKSDFSTPKFNPDQVNPSAVIGRTFGAASENMPKPNIPTVNPNQVNPTAVIGRTFRDAWAGVPSQQTTQAAKNNNNFLGLSKDAWIGTAGTIPIQQQSKPRTIGSLSDDELSNILKPSLGASPKKQVTSTSVSNQPSSSGFGAFAKNMVAPSHDDGSWNPVGGLVNTITGLGGAALGTVGGLAAGAGEGIRSTAAFVGGGDNSNRGNMVAPSFDFAGNGLSQAKLGVRQMFGLTPKKEATSSTPANSAPPATKPDAKVADTAAKAAEKAKADAVAKAANNTQPQPSDFPTTQQPIGQQQNSDPYAIQQKGNSFSYANPSAAAEARAAGVPELQRTGIQTGRGIRGVNEFMANTREMGPTEQQIQNAIAQREMNLGMQGYGGNPVQAPQRNEAQEAERQAVIRAASAPIAGARGLTANQVRTLSDLQQGEDNRANQRYTTDANNVATLQREAMGQAGQNYRTELGEQGTNNRYNSGLNLEAQKFNATNDLANREFNLSATEKGFGIRNSARVEKLYEQYDKAETDEQRKSIQEKINRYSGKAESSNPYITVKRGEILDEKGNTIQPAGEVLVNYKTGEITDPLAQMTQNMQQPLQNHIDALKKNPSQAAQFDEIYGQGASAKYLS